MRSSDRAVSETAGVAVLIALTVLVTLSIGVGVLLFNEEEESGGQADIRFQYAEGPQVLVVQHDGGDELRAGSVYIEGPANNVTWATLEQMEASEPVGPGDSALVSEGSAYGEVVGADELFTVVYSPPDGNSTVLGQWNSGGGEEGP